MKLRASINISLALCFSAFTLTQSSCSKWFDVNPKTDVKADALFNSEHGFQSALAGLYITMTDDELYGQNLSYGMIEQMAQVYDRLPYGLGDDDRHLIYTYKKEEHRYNTKNTLASIWSKGYNVIANGNNLMKWLERKGDVIIRQEQTRKRIKAEALAIRAYIHFDFLRGWGPIYKDNPEAKSIPYRLVIDNSKQATLPATRILELIIKDLEEARHLLAFESKQTLLAPNEPRRFRMNYHAVTALLARVYCYKGDAEKAIEAAQEVISNSGLTLQVNNQQDPVQYRETILGVNKYKLLEGITQYFSTDTEGLDEKYFSSLATYKKIFEVSGNVTEDIRAKNSAFVFFNDQEKVITRKYLQNEEECIPLIRLPEMYYILAEMSPLSSAAKYINQVRNKRGLPSSANIAINSEAERREALNKEYRKEFYGEGQYFFFLKRLGFTTFINCPMTDFGAEQYVFPRPDAEIEFGWSDDAEGTSTDSE